MKFTLYSLFLAVVSAQCNEDVTINSQDDVSQISSCTSYSGQITIEKVAESDLQIANLRTVSGSLVVQNNFSLKTISFDNLVSVSQNFQLQNNTELLGISFPKLNSVNNFQIIYNPNLKEMSSGTIDTVSNYQIIQTSLSRIVPVDAQTVTNIEISDNSFLTPINFPRLVNNTGYINIVNNGPQATVTFPSLGFIKGNATFRDLSGFDASNLTTISDTFNILGNFFEKLSLKNLSTLEKDLSITNNTKLSTVEIPILKNLGGGLQILNNPQLPSISNDTFTALNYIKGGVTLSGDFDSVVFPSLQRVDGAFSLTSLSSNFSCSPVQSNYKPTVKGTFACKATGATASGGGSGSSTKSGAGSFILPNLGLSGSCVSLVLLAATLLF